MSSAGDSGEKETRILALLDAACGQSQEPAVQPAAPSLPQTQPVASNAPRVAPSAAAALRNDDEESRAALRARIVNRFDLVAENASASAKPVAWGTGFEPHSSKVRYHEGVVVATRGEKYVVEKVKPEWDGGSTGRVKTKGKRGTGWA